MQNWEELSKSRTCKSVTQKVKETSRSTTQQKYQSSGNTWHSELTSENRNGSHKTLLWVISYLPSLIKNTPLVMAAVQVAANRRYRILWRSFTVSPEPAAVLFPASSVSAGQHSEKKRDTRFVGIEIGLARAAWGIRRSSRVAMNITSVHWLFCVDSIAGSELCRSSPRLSRIRSSDKPNLFWSTAVRWELEGAGALALWGRFISCCRRLVTVTEGRW